MSVQGQGQGQATNSLSNGEPWRCRSRYVTAPDGTDLALYVFRRNDSSEEAQPVVWALDRYHQVEPKPLLDLTEDRWPGHEPEAWGPVNRPTLLALPWAHQLVRSGFTVVIVDSRGSGASGGVSTGPFDTAEADDCYCVTEWIAAQPWCDGSVGMAGRSYLGVMQYLAASRRPPHLRAIMPQMSLFDLYGFAYDGGIFRQDFAESWSRDLKRRDVDVTIRPVDTDPDGARLAAALLEHADNADADALFRSLCNRDDVVAQTGERLYTTRSPSEVLAAINDSGVSVCHVAGWHDVWVTDAFRYAGNLRVPFQLIVGPWAHTTGLVGGSGLSLAEEHMRFFDQTLRGAGTARQSARIRYFTIGAEVGSAWRTAETWPLPEEERHTMWLRNGSMTTYATKSTATGADTFTLDPTTTTGSATRWTSGYGGPIAYADLADNDAKTLHYDSAPLAEPLELTGHLRVRLHLGVDSADADLHLYLAAVDGQGVSRYVTEGSLRLSRRTVTDAPYDVAGSPFRSGLKADATARPVTPEEELVVELKPISQLFPAGTRLRLTLMGADAGNAQAGGAPAGTIYRVHAGSLVELPVIGSAAGLLGSENASAVGSAILSTPAGQGPADDRLVASTLNGLTQEGLKADLLEVWRSILECDEIQADDEFFALGGDSLRLIRLSASLRSRYNIRPKLYELLTASTPALQSELVWTYLREQHEPSAHRGQASGVTTGGT